MKSHLEVLIIELRDRRQKVNAFEQEIINKTSEAIGEFKDWIDLCIRKNLNITHEILDPKKVVVKFNLQHGNKKESLTIELPFLSNEDGNAIISKIEKWINEENKPKTGRKEC